MSNRFITLVRHGKVDGPAALYGRTDIGLSEAGRADLQRALQVIHQQIPIDQIISSPLQRCAKVAQEFSAQHAVPFLIESGLQEMYFGRWDGIAFDDLGDEWENLAHFWDSPATAQAPDGEALQDFAIRVINAWQQVICSTTAAHQVIVCHGGVIRIIIAHILTLNVGTPSLFQQLQIDYASQTRISIGCHDQAQPVINYIGLPSA